MCKEQKDFVQLLEEIGETEIKSGAAKAADFGKSVRILMDQFRDMEENEREVLLEGCITLREDYAGKASLFASQAALAVSAIVAFISALAIIITMVGGVVDADMLFVSSIGVLILSTLIFVATIGAFITSHKMSKIADRYTNASLALTILRNGNQNNCNKLP